MCARVSPNHQGAAAQALNIAALQRSTLRAAITESLEAYALVAQ